MAVVTGAGRGIGRAIAMALAGRGWQVVLAARTSSEVEAAAAAIREQGAASAEAVVTDIARDEDVARLFERAHRAFGPVTLLVNNAGTLSRTALLDLTIEEFDRTMAVNLRGAVLCSLAAFKDMVTTGGGGIVNIASLSGVAGVEKFPGLTPYVVSKFGLVGLTEALSVEGRPFNIWAVALSPGAVDTALLKLAAPHLKAGMSPEEAAELVVFLASEGARSLSGVNLPIFSNIVATQPFLPGGEP